MAGDADREADGVEEPEDRGADQGCVHLDELGLRFPDVEREAPALLHQGPAREVLD